MSARLAFEPIVFIQGEEAEEPLRILDADGIDALARYLAQWDQRDRVPSEPEHGAGTSDNVREVRLGRDRFLVTYNARFGYCGLHRIVNA